MDDIIELNVGGGIFVTTRGTLCAEAGSMLAAKFDEDSSFAPPKELDGAVFLDRNFEAFGYILDYLRNRCRVEFDIPPALLKQLRADSDYFGLVGLKACCGREIASPPGAKERKCCTMDSDMYDDARLYYEDDDAMNWHFWNWRLF
mmetsp:Transcript_11384/g.24664  ORF Transcript_11384/g.24664 Transcript_11384/m.24664 type:complete len:146 (-) Transcript_11384:156-593(-)|eukprot:CAMPEP_0178581848 /NCGR_PEP_ID=MMETSP0697-20121206/23406_1 /TAXON_ID=265572 /ORGANISM="Extubocellulus spinifer, Strain CCMP396" /LENGTH=145 /DNA_ID=CAMNT_0020217533 /DNA_START=23 /DNA_END=460 /DNA_ORIENTATION=+